MKTKIVYVVVSDKNDIYLEQAYVSMYSLRKFNPNIHIILLTDDLTNRTFTGIRKKMVALADDIITVKLDEKKYNAQKRSRYLKTSVRKYIQGDFLFVDCDTIITRPLDDIDQCSHGIAACWDTHSSFMENPYREHCLRHAWLLGWPLENEREYFNSGVIYCKDNAKTRAFYERWHENWLRGLKKGVSMDQPAFAKTNWELDHPVKVLHDTWNCELKHGIKFLRDARIVHYLCTNPSRGQNRQLFLMNEKNILLSIKKDAEISSEINKIIENPFEGLATPTHCFAGDDVFFFNTKQYNLLRKQFKHRPKKTLGILLKAYLKVYSYKTKITRCFLFLMNKKCCKKLTRGGVNTSTFDAGNVISFSCQSSRRAAA